MRFRPQLKVLVCGVGMALAAGSAIAGPWGSPAQGETGQGVDTVQANGFNPRGLDPSLERSADGLSEFRQPASHTPTGQMYSIPWAAPEEKSMSGSVEFGLLYGGSDNDAAKLKEYRDFESGFVLNYFHFGAAGDNNRFFDVFGGGVGRDDQYYAGTFGVYNDFKIKGFYNETPHVFTTTARPLWNGINTGYLALKQPLQFTGNPSAAASGSTLNLKQVVQNTPDTEIALIRKKGGLRFDKTMSDTWSIYSAYTLEKREGGRTFGATGGGFPAAFNLTLPSIPLTLAAAGANAGRPVQLVEPIDYRSHEFTIGSAWTKLGWADALNVSFSASIFKDDLQRFLWENPFAEPNLTVNRHVQSMSLPPSNEAYYARVDYAKALPNLWNGRIKASLQYGRITQDEELQPHTSVTGTIGTAPIANTVPAGVVCANCGNAAYWNSIIAPNGIQTLSQLTADQETDSKLAEFNLSLSPMKRLSVSGKFRFYETDKKSTYVNCNPALTAEAFGLTAADAIARCKNASGPAVYGYVREDGVASNIGIVPNISSDTPFRGNPYDTRSIIANLGGTYKLTNTTSINANYEHENVYRPFRERDKTEEDKYKIGLVMRDLGDGTLRTSYEYNDRGGSAYKADAYYDWYSLNHPSTITITAANGATANANLRAVGPAAGQKHDINNREQHIMIARYNYMFTNTLDGMVTAKRAVMLYPEGPGRDTRREDNLSFELNYQPTVATTTYAFYTWQNADQSQHNIQGGATANCANLTVEQCSLEYGVAGSVYATAASTRYFTEDKNHVFGLGLTHRFDMLTFDGSYQYTKTDSEVSYIDNNNPGGGNALDGLLIYFPDMEYDRHVLNLSATVPINKQSSLRFLYMFEKANVADWHYDGLATYSQVPGEAYYLDAGPAQSYRNHAVGAFWQYKM